MRPRFTWIAPLALMLFCTTVLLVHERNPELATGCTPPRNENRLLDRYGDDKAFAARPPQARDGGTVRHRGCVRQNREDVGTTAVSRRWFGKRAYGVGELHGLYGVAGWRRAPATVPLGGGTPTYLRYCRIIESTVSYLSVALLDATGDEAARDDPFEVQVQVTAYAAERSCPPAPGAPAAQSALQSVRR